MIHQEAWYREADVSRRMGYDLERLNAALLRSPNDVNLAMQMWDALKRSRDVNLGWGRLSAAKDYESIFTASKAFLKGISERVSEGGNDPSDWDALWHFARFAKELPPVSREVLDRWPPSGDTFRVAKRLTFFSMGGHYLDDLGGWLAPWSKGETLTDFSPVRSPHSSVPMIWGPDHASMPTSLGVLLSILEGCSGEWPFSSPLAPANRDWLPPQAGEEGWQERYYIWVWWPYKDELSSENSARLLDWANS